MANNNKAIPRAQYKHNINLHFHCATAKHAIYLQRPIIHIFLCVDSFCTVYEYIAEQHCVYRLGKNYLCFAVVFFFLLFMAGNTTKKVWEIVAYFLFNVMAYLWFNISIGCMSYTFSYYIGISIKSLYLHNFPSIKTKELRW